MSNKLSDCLYAQLSQFHLMKSRGKLHAEQKMMITQRESGLGNIILSDYIIRPFLMVFHQTTKILINYKEKETTKTTLK